MDEQEKKFIRQNKQTLRRIIKKRYEELKETSVDSQFPNEQLAVAREYRNFWLVDKLGEEDFRKNKNSMV